MLTIILDNVRKPRNIGAVMRVAAAAGAQLVLTGHCGSPDAETARFAAVGTAPQVSIRRAPSLAAVLLTLRQDGVATIGTTPRATTPYWDLDLTGPVALVFGNEVGGLGVAKLDQLDHVARIPMTSGVDSLNLATAVAVLTFESVRQRSQAAARPGPLGSGGKRG